MPHRDWEYARLCHGYPIHPPVLFLMPGFLLRRCRFDRPFKLGDADAVAAFDGREFGSYRR
jgi:hypothetical protein